MKTIVVGAGLTYAKVLTERNHEAAVFEASDGLGGQVRTDERLPENRTGTTGIVIAGEYTEDSSINGSMLFGEKAAEEVMRA